MKGPCRLLPLFALLGAAQGVDEEDVAIHGAYRCTLKPDPVGTLDIAQTLTARGRLLETSASWVEPSAYSIGRAGRTKQEPSERGYMTISVEGRKSPSKTEAGWFDLAGARVQITVVTARKLRGAAAVTFRRPSRVGDRYEDGLSLLASNSKHVRWTIAAAPYRVLSAFAEDERELTWHLTRRVGGDVGRSPEAHGRFDLGKVDAFARSVDAARPALAALRADYRSRCQFLPPVADEESDTI